MTSKIKNFKIRIKKNKLKESLKIGEKMNKIKYLIKY